MATRLKTFIEASLYAFQPIFESLFVPFKIFSSRSFVSASMARLFSSFCLAFVAAS